MGRHRLFILGCSLLFFVLVGIGGTARAIETTNMRLTVTPGTPTPASTSAREPSSGVGLGETRASVEQSVGRPTGLNGTMIAYAGGKLAVSYEQGRATGVLINFESPHTSLEAARGHVQDMLPTDRVLVGTMADGANRIADVYQSSQLSSLSSVATSTSTPGQFVVVYEDDGTGAIRDALVLVGGIPKT